jgi:hypothetical protein
MAKELSYLRSSSDPTSEKSKLDIAEKESIIQ